MESEQFQRALTRLAAVIERLERIEDMPAAPDTGAAARLAALEERHHVLKHGAAEALARLDRLIGAGGQG